MIAPPTTATRSPLVRAVVTVDPDGRHRLVFAYRDGQRPIAPTPSAPRPVRPSTGGSSIPATAREVAARMGAPPPVPGPGGIPKPVWVSSGPPPPPEECLALRERLGLSQREAAEGAGVSRGLVSALESPRPPHRAPWAVQTGRGRRVGERVGSPQTDTYLAWLRGRVAGPVA